MKKMFKLCALIAFVFISTVNQAQDLPCETAPGEGYHGSCDLRASMSADGKYVYTSNRSDIKQWDVKTKQVTGDWNVGTNNVDKLHNVSDDYRFISYQSYRGFSVLDTQTGKKFEIENFEVLHVFGKLNLALIKKDKSVFVYDLNTKKKKYLSDMVSESPLKVAEATGRVAFSFEENIMVFDVQSGKKVFSLRMDNDRHPLFNFSSNGKYLVTRTGITDVDTKKVVTVPFTYYNADAHFIFTPDLQHLFFVRNYSEFYNHTWNYGFDLLQKYNLTTGQKELEVTDDWRNGTMLPLREDSYKIFPADNSTLYVFNEKSLSLVSEESFSKLVDKIDFIGGIGKGGQAQIAKAEEEKNYLASLTKAMIPKFQSLQPSEFQFPVRNQLNVLDHNSQTGVVMIGDYRQVGIFKMPEGKLIQSFGSNPNTMKLGPGDNTTVTRMQVKSGAVNKDGSIISISSEDAGSEISDVYKNGILLSRLPGVLVTKILDDHQAIAWLPQEQKLSLYDFIAKKSILTYNVKAERDISLSPDQTKILVLDANKVFDVQSGKLLMSAKSRLDQLSNKYAIFCNGRGFDLYDINNGTPVSTKGWDEKKTGKVVACDNQYIITFKPDGPMYVFDVDQMKYVSEKPVVKINETAFERHLYFANGESAFVLYDQGFPGYHVDGADTEVATAYCVNMRTGELTPYLWHPNRQDVKTISTQQNAAVAPDPDVTSLLNTLKYFPAQYKFDYNNFEYLNLMNNPVGYRFFAQSGTDKVYAIGRFCQGVGGITPILVLSVKNTGPNEQYIFSLLDVGRKGIVNNNVIGYTQKVNGNVTELTNVEVLKVDAGFNINVTTGSNKKTVSVAGSCN